MKFHQFSFLIEKDATGGRWCRTGKTSTDFPPFPPIGLRKNGKNPPNFEEFSPFSGGKQVNGAGNE